MTTTRHGTRTLAAATCLAGALALAGCETSTGLEQLTATGTVTGVVWVDANDNQQLDGGDPRLPGARVLLRRVQGGAVLAESTTGEEGAYVMEEVPLGDYVVTVDLASVTPGLGLLTGDTAVRVTALEDQAQANVGLVALAGE